MPTTEHNSPRQDSQPQDSRLHVVVGILHEQGRLLIQQRVPASVCAGQWEFPGGKVEPGESAPEALHRELKEELGVDTLTTQPLMQFPFDYPHAKVWLEVFLINSFTNHPHGKEGQPTQWQTPPQIRQLDILPAVFPILDVLDELL